MAIQVKWDEQHPHILRVLLGSHDWTELYSTMQTLKTIDAEATERYDIVFSIEGNMPKGNPLPHFRAMYNTLKNLNHVRYLVNIVDKRTMFATKLLEIIFKTTGVLPNIVFIESVEKAYELLDSSPAVHA